MWWTWDLRLTTSLVLWLLYVSYLMLRNSAEAGSASIMAAALAVVAFLDVPMVYLANRWFRTSQPQTLIGDSLPAAMKFALMTNVIGFLTFAALICGFRYGLERREQKLAGLQRQKAAAGTLALALPAMMLFQAPHGTRSAMFMYAGYIAAWTIYLVYLALLLRRMMRLRAEESELATNSHA